MVKVIGVRYRDAGQIYYFSPGQETFQYGDTVLVHTQESLYYAKVVIPNKEVAEEDLPSKVKEIVRRATAKDQLEHEQNLADAKEALKIGKQKIKQRNLEMKLVSIEYSFDRAKMVFQFTADGRIDFRDLVKDLAGVFRTRIELRQIGVRDEAKLLGGIGPCGRQLCCSTFLGDFVPVSIKMAKDQGLSLNPTKISGLCGRLMCCLSYENDTYEEAKKALPDYGKEIMTPDGKGKVTGLNMLNRVVQVRLFGQPHTVVEYDYEELKELTEVGGGHENG